MQSLFPQAVVFAVLAAFFASPSEVSAQLFRRLRDDARQESNSGAKSHLPNPNGAIRAGNYGPLEAVSDEVRAEVSGTIPPRPAPDFRANPEAAADYMDAPKLQRTITPKWYTGGTPSTPPRIRPLNTVALESENAE